MAKWNAYFAFFPYGGSEYHRIRTWWGRTLLACKSDSRIDDITHEDYNDTPITMMRNRAVKDALAANADILCMIDSDIWPDRYMGIDPSAQRFWKSSLEFMFYHPGPCVIAAPYCGPPPHENVFVFRWANLQSDHPNADLKLVQYTREEAAIRGGMEEVAAVPTGLILIDLRTVNLLTPPWFEYGYADPPFNTIKNTTEDVFFTRNLSLAGVPQYVNWDAWATHRKGKDVGKPSLLTSDQVKQNMREAILRDAPSGEKLIDIRPDPTLRVLLGSDQDELAS